MIDPRSRLSDLLVTIYSSKMLRGLVYLRSEGVIRRDIKAAMSPQLIKVRPSSRGCSNPGPPFPAN